MGLTEGALCLYTPSLPSQHVSPAPGRKRLPQGRSNSNTTNQLALPQPRARWVSVSEEKDDVGRGNNTDLRKKRSLS